MVLAMNHLENVERVEQACKEFLKWKKENKKADHEARFKKVTQISKKYKFRTAVLYGVFSLDRNGNSITDFRVVASRRTHNSNGNAIALGKG